VIGGIKGINSGIPRVDIITERLRHFLRFAAQAVDDG